MASRIQINIVFHCSGVKTYQLQTYWIFFPPAVRPNDHAVFNTYPYVKCESSLSRQNWVDSKKSIFKSTCGDLYTIVYLYWLIENCCSNSEQVCFDILLMIPQISCRFVYHHIHFGKLCFGWCRAQLWLATLWKKGDVVSPFCLDTSPQ